MREFRSEQEERAYAYREQAELFMIFAEPARTDDCREAYLRLATEWLRLAAEVEKSYL